MSEPSISTTERLTIAEDMTIYQAAAQKQLLLAALHAADELDVDLSAVGEMDTAGVQLLLMVKREAALRGKTVRIVAHSAAVREVLDFFQLAAQLGDPILIPAEERG